MTTQCRLVKLTERLSKQFSNIGFFIVLTLEVLLGSGRPVQQMQNPGLQLAISFKVHDFHPLPWESCP